MGGSRTPGDCILNYRLRRSLGGGEMSLRQPNECKGTGFAYGDDPLDG